MTGATRDTAYYTNGAVSGSPVVKQSLPVIVPPKTDSMIDTPMPSIGTIIANAKAAALAQAAKSPTVVKTAPVIGIITPSTVKTLTPGLPMVTGSTTIKTMLTPVASAAVVKPIVTLPYAGTAAPANYWWIVILLGVGAVCWMVFGKKKGSYAR